MKFGREIKINKYYIKIVGLYCKHCDPDRFLDHVYNLKNILNP